MINMPINRHSQYMTTRYSGPENRGAIPISPMTYTYGKKASTPMNAQKR